MSAESPRFDQGFGADVLDLKQAFAREGRFAWRVLARFGVGAADLPDACQDVFMVVYRRSAEFDASRSLRAWIFGICVKVAADYRKRRRGRREVSADVVVEPSAPAGQERDLEREEARKALQQAIDTLDDEPKALFVLYELEEMPMSEVAKTLGIPVQTAYARLHAARKLVATAFRRADAFGRAKGASR